MELGNYGMVREGQDNERFVGFKASNHKIFYSNLSGIKSTQIETRNNDTEGEWVICIDI